MIPINLKVKDNNKIVCKSKEGNTGLELKKITLVNLNLCTSTQSQHLGD